MEPIYSHIGIPPFSDHLSETKETVHTWVFNAFTKVNLIRVQDRLEYEVIDIAEGPLFKGLIEISESKTIEQTIEHLKKCKVSINPTHEVRFLFCYHSWKIGSKEEASLVKVTEKSVMWNIFSASTQQCSLFSISESTIPSARCHLDTIARIQKIETELMDTPNIFSLKSLVKDFTVTRILDAETIKEEMKSLEKDRENVLKLWREYFKTAHDLGHRNPLNLGPASSWKTDAELKLALNAAVVTSESVKPFMKGRLLGGVAGSILATTLGIVTVGSGVAIPLVALSLFYLAKKEIQDNPQKEVIENKVRVLSPLKPLFVEIEPINMPSLIDPRVRISKFFWVVTLITGPEGDSKAHASIAVEGLVNSDLKKFLKNEQLSIHKVSQGQYFMHKSEFNPPIRSHIRHPDKFKRDRASGIQRSEIWIRSSEKVIAMMQEIEKEKKFQEEQEKKGIKPILSKFGKDSVFSEGHNSCFTWARGILKKMLDIDLVRNTPLTVPSSLLVYPKDYTKLFEEYDKDPVINEI